MTPHEDCHLQHGCLLVSDGIANPCCFTIVVVAAVRQKLNLAKLQQLLVVLTIGLDYMSCSLQSYSLDFLLLDLDLSHSTFYGLFFVRGA